jgi:hypothetical protein
MEDGKNTRKGEKKKREEECETGEGIMVEMGTG